ncbi:hypothetical protein B0H13DRAFT_2414157 [Mycena leptocephala]|nr:hypothetical protein B0H13DRAFT_2414157 [Mycena leptocephala]
MPLPRLFRSSAPNDWLSTLLLVAKCLIPVGNCIPVPCVGTALASGLALLELIQMVGKSNDDLKYLAQSVVAVMKLLREEMDSHRNIDKTEFRQVCLEFEAHLMQLSKDLELMSKNWSSSKFRKYLNSNRVRDEIVRFTRQLDDLRANATLSAATGTRMDLAGVANGVAAVEAKISQLREKLVDQRPPLSITTTQTPQNELVRFEEDFHALKLGDIHLAFQTARTAIFHERDGHRREKRRTGWTDYKATIRGSLHTVRVYEGSDPTQSWKNFLSFLADHSPLINLLQVPLICHNCLAFVALRDYDPSSSTEFRSLDEYGSSLPSAQAIVDWELSLISTIAELQGSPDHRLLSSLDFALVNAQNGNLVISHIEESTPSGFRERYSPFLEWLVWTGWSALNCRKLETESDGRMRSILRSLVRLQRDDDPAFQYPDQIFFRDVFGALTSRGSVYHRSGGPPIARLLGCNMAPNRGWDVLYFTAPEQCDGSAEGHIDTGPAFWNASLGKMMKT